MSQVVIEISTVVPDGPGKTTPVIAGAGYVQEITSSGASQATTIAATADTTSIATVINNGADALWVAFGEAPVAAVGAGKFVPPQTTRDFGLLRGQRVAVINDS